MQTVLEKTLKGKRGDGKGALRNKVRGELVKTLNQEKGKVEP